MSTTTGKLITNLSKWEPMIDKGVCLVPTRNGIPVEPWGKYTEPHTLLELYDKIDKKNADGLEIVCGRRSGNLVCIDVDSKYKAGFEVQLFEFMRVFEWWERLVIDRSPSGGYHLYFRVDYRESDQVVGNPKVCRRPSTEEELSLNPQEKTKCFLEIKGEGGLSRCWPSDGYERRQGSEYPVLSYGELLSIMTLCESFNEDILEVKPPKAPSSQDEWYVQGENPYDSYNLSYNGGLLDELGWTLQSESGGYKKYSKPARKGKSKDIDVTYNISKRFYKVHAANCGISCGVYSPVSLLVYLKFPGRDGKKECYQWLIKEGYGRLKPEREKSIVRNRAESNTPLPSNISKSGVEEYNRLVEAKKSQYPYGTFWDINEQTGVVTINRENLYHVSGQLGFRLYKNSEICIISGHIVEITTDRVYYDLLKQYIGAEADEDIRNEYEKFIQHNGKFTISRIPVLDESRVLRSNKYKSYKGYRNGYLVITSDEITLEKYEDLDKMIWKHQIQSDRDFYENGEKYVPQSLFYKFLDKAIVGGWNEHTQRCIGYYTHEYKSTTTSYIVVLCENCDNPKKGGGAGKNIFTNMLGWSVGLLNKPAKGMKFDDTMLRTWNSTKRILSINDAEKKFEYLALKEYASGEGEVGKKFVQEVTISNSEMPKFIVNTNFSFDPSQPGLKRRLIGLEFTSFFIEHGGVDVYFQKDFPGDKVAEHDWTLEDWIGYDWIIVKSIQSFLAGGCKLRIPEMSDGGWTKQFEQRFYQLTHQFINENIESWVESGEVLIEKVFSNTHTSTYSIFCNENGVDKTFRLSSVKMNEALDEYCSHHGIYFEKYKNSKYNGIQVNVKVFKRLPTEKRIQEIEEEQDVDWFSNEKEDLPF